MSEQTKILNDRLEALRLRCADAAKLAARLGASPDHLAAIVLGTPLEIETSHSAASLRKLVAKVITTEGCGCCRGNDHWQLSDELAQALGVPRYSDNSGYDWFAVAKDIND